MPAELLMVRRGSVLAPAWRLDEQEMDAVPTGRALTVKISRTANPKVRAWYRALLSKLVSATGLWPNPEDAHRQLLIRCGFCESVMVTDFGDIRFTPESTQGWDEIRWRNYLDVLVLTILSDILPGVPRRHLFREVEEMVGIRFTEAMKEDPS